MSEAETRQPDPTPGGPALGAAAGRGLSILFLAVGAQRVLAVISTIIVGHYLGLADYALYGLAIGVQAFIQTFRDGGVRDYLLQRQEHYRELIGPCFWLSFTINLVVGVVMGVAGEIYARVLVANGKLESAADLTLLLWLSAAALPLGSIPAVMLTRLRIDLNYRGQLVYTLVMGLTRYGGSIVLAMMGWGAMALVAPVILSTIAEGVVLYLYTREKPWTMAPRVRVWREILSKSGWLVLGAMAAGVANQGYFVAAGLVMADQDALGLFVFAVSLMMQVEQLVTMTLTTGLLPILVKIQGQKRRLGEACLRITRSVPLICAPASAALALAFPMIDRLLWHGKFAGASGAMLLLAVAFPLRALMVVVPHTLLTAEGRFRDFFLMWLRNGVGLLVAAVAGPLIFGDSTTGLAIGVACFLGLSSLLSTVLTLRGYEVPVLATVSAALQALVLAALAGALAILLDRSVIGPQAAELAARFDLGPAWLARRLDLWAVAEAAIVLGVFGVAFALLVRLLAANDLRQTLDRLPARLAYPVRVVMHLR